MILRGVVLRNYRNAFVELTSVELIGGGMFPIITHLAAKINTFFAYGNFVNQIS